MVNWKVLPPAGEIVRPPALAKAPGAIVRPGVAVAADTAPADPAQTASTTSAATPSLALRAVWPHRRASRARGERRRGRLLRASPKSTLAAYSIGRPFQLPNYAQYVLVRTRRNTERRRLADPRPLTRAANELANATPSPPSKSRRPRVASRTPLNGRRVARSRRAGRSLLLAPNPSTRAKPFSRGFLAGLRDGGGVVFRRGAWR